MDLVTRLLLNTNQFDDNLKNSTKQVQNFQKVGQSVTSAIGKFAGIIGIAGGAMETFNKFIESGQGTADQWSFALGTAKDTVDLFFTSLNTGDFTAFNRGITNTINQLYELQKLRDDLADTKNSTNVMRSQYSYQAQELKAIINDPSSTKAQIAAAKKQLLKITQDFTKQLDEQNKINVAELTQNANTKTGRYYTQNDINNFATVYNNPASADSRKKKFDAYNKRMDELESKLYVTTSHSTNYGSVTTKGKDAKVEAQILALRKQNNELDRMRILSKQSDKQWAEYYNSLNEYYQTKSEAAQNLNFAIKQEKRADTRLGTGTGNNSNKKGARPEEVINSGSIDQINKELADARKKYNAAATDELRQELFKVVEDIESRKIKLEFVAKYGEMKDVKPKMAGVLGDKTEYKFPDQIEPIKSPVSVKDIKVNNEYVDSLNAISNTLNSVTNMTNEGASAWINWGATLLSAIAAAIPAIAALTVAKKVEANANAEAAVTGAASSVAAIPFVGAIMAVAAIASVIAALAAIPKFATGGIVGGSSTSGDRILARLNSGEMVLNTKQQGNLFRLLDGGSSSSGEIKNVEFKIRGKDLVGTIDNYNSKVNKVK